MTISNPEHDSMMQRLTRLERQNRWLKRGLGTVFVLLGSLVFMGATTIQDQLQALRELHITQLETERIVLRDNTGMMRGWIGTAENGSHIIFYDSNGRQKAGFGVTKAFEPALAFFDPDQNQRLVMGMVDGWPAMIFRDAANQKRIALHAQEQGSSLFFFDAREKRRAAMGMYEDAAVINLADAQEVDRVGLTTDPQGASLVFFDGKGKKRIGLGVLKEDNPALGFFSEEGLPRMSMAAFGRAPTFSLLGTNRFETVMDIGTNGPQVQMFGPGRKTLWKAP